MLVSSLLCAFRLIYGAKVFVSNGPKFSDHYLHQIFANLVLLECLVLPHYGHAEKPNPNPGCFEVSDWFCLWLYFDHIDSVISKIKRFRFTRCELSTCIQWALLKITEVATVGCLCHWEYAVWTSLDINSGPNSSYPTLEENYSL